MDNTLKRLEEKTDKILSEIVEIKIDLATHIQRTSIAEERLEMIKADVDPLKTDLIMRAAKEQAKKELSEKRKGWAAFLLKAFAVAISLYALIHSLS